MTQIPPMNIFMLVCDVRKIWIKSYESNANLRPFKRVKSTILETSLVPVEGVIVTTISVGNGDGVPRPRYEASSGEQVRRFLGKTSSKRRFSVEKIKKSWKFPGTGSTWTGSGGPERKIPFPTLTIIVLLYLMLMQLWK